MLRKHVILAVFRRNVSSYFSGVLGYLVIVVFVVAGAFMAFSPQFFTNNLTNLDQLSDKFPLLLLFLVPAITMSTWADEKKLGTEELLFTLPASDVEILLGKYLAALAIYSIALAFSFTHMFVLAWIGDPDWGVMFTTYLGYWLAGATMLSAGMFASVLTSSTTVAFVLGTTICAIPVFIGRLASSEIVQTLGLGDVALNLSIGERLRDFTMGMIPLSGLFYFISMTALMLYLNLVFITRRHWSGSQQANMGVQFAVRVCCAAIALVSLNALVLDANAEWRGDMTAENLYSLSPTTRELLSKIDAKHPITIQAYLSPEVPREYVSVRKQLIGLLRQYALLAGNHIDVRFVDVAPFSEQTDEAKLYGIEPKRVASERDGRRIQEDVFLGVVVTSSFDQVVIPFFGPGTPVEYELTRSIRTASNEKRPTVGILRTEAEVMGFSNEWRIVSELKKQYNVVEVSPDSAIAADKYDVLMAVMPSSLTQPQMENLVNYVKAGHPTLIFDDPYPVWFQTMFGVTKAPRLPKASPGGGGMFGGMRGQAEPKADDGKATSLLRVLKLAWDNGEVVWDSFMPHPEFGSEVPPEYIFVMPRKDAPSAFSKNSEVTSGLQEILAAYAGRIRPMSGSEGEVKFEPLMQTGTNSGVLAWEEFTEQAFDPMHMQQTARPSPNPSRFADGESHVLAAHLTSNNKDSKLNVIYVADFDMISDWFFIQREQNDIDLDLDNVTFVLNAVDVLAGDRSYLELRKRRPAHRTLVRVEERTAEFIRDRNKEEADADRKAKAGLAAAKKRFHNQIELIEKDTSLNARTKDIMIANLKENEERRLDVEEANLNREKQKAIDQIKARTERQVRSTEDRIRYLAVIIPPIPAVLLGIYLLSQRLYHERRDIRPERLALRDEKP